MTTNNLKSQIYEYLKSQEYPLSYESIKKNMGIHQPIYSELVGLVMENKIIKRSRGEEFVYSVS